MSPRGNPGSLRCSNFVQIGGLYCPRNHDPINQTAKTAKKRENSDQILGSGGGEYFYFVLPNCEKE